MRKMWTNKEVERLQKLYPVSDFEDLYAAFPGRSVAALRKKAAELGLHRPHTGGQISRWKTIAESYVPTFLKLK